MQGWRRLKVTKELITKAIPRDSSHCMVADTIKSQISGAKRVSVDLATIRFSVGDKRYIFLTPRTVQQALIWFDQGDSRLSPFSFDLRVPAQVVPTGRKTPDRRPESKRSRIKATTKAVVIANAGQRAPDVIGGKTPPMGSLLGGDLSGSAKVDAVVRGKIRRFGLKGLTA